MFEQNLSFCFRFVHGTNSNNKYRYPISILKCILIITMKLKYSILLVKSVDCMHIINNFKDKIYNRITF